MAVVQPNMQRVQLARTLPRLLFNFLQKYPPSSSQLQLSGSNVTSTPSTASEPTKSQQEFLNPFQPQKDPSTGNWVKPVYSLRKQADLVKMASARGLEDLLPPTMKNTGEKLRKRQEHGLRVKGTGVGQRVKGHKWERTLKPRLEERRVAMLGMPKLIREWKEKGHGRGWKKWPK